MQKSAPTPNRVLFIYGGFESYGIECLSSFLKEHGVNTELFFFSKLFDDSIINIPFLSRHCNFLETEKLIESIRKNPPSLIGFSVVSNDYLWACSVAKIIKAELPGIPIIFGGIHPTLVPENVIINEFVDFVCQGDGEESLLRLIECLQSNKTFFDIPNIWYKHQGTIVKPQVYAQFNFSDSNIIPDKDIFYDNAPYLKIAGTYMFTRGCFYKCSYCCHSALKKDCDIKFQNLSTEKAINQLLELKNKYGLKRIIFDDDLFVFNEEWSIEFLKIYKEKIRLPFFAVIHPLFVTEKIIKALKKAGCKKIEIAVQTFNEGVRRDILLRNESNRDIKRAIDIIQKSEIPFNIQHIMGIMGTDIIDEIRAAYYYSHLKVKRIFPFYLTYYPRCEITDMAFKKGLIDKKKLDQIELGIVESYEINGDIQLDKLDDYNNMRLLFALIPILPGAFIRFFLKKKRYCKLQKLSYLFRFMDLINTFISMESTANIFVLRYIYHTPRLIFKGILKIIKNR